MMAASSFPIQERSVSSYHDELWRISWGEQTTIAAIREEMSRGGTFEDGNGRSPWNRSQVQCQPQAPISHTKLSTSAPSYQPSQLQAVGFVMTRIAGAQVPAIVFSTQQEQCPPHASCAESNGKQTGSPQVKEPSWNHTIQSDHTISTASGTTPLTGTSKDADQ